MKNPIRPVGLFAEHPLQGVLHAAPQEHVVLKCKGHNCLRIFTGGARKVLDMYRDHVLDRHWDELVDCGCCGGYHFPDFTGDCREDWERF